MSLQVPVFVALLALSPRPSAHPLPGWAETVEEHRARLASFATDVAAVARTRAEAGILIGIAWHESGFAPDVDAGKCYLERGWKSRCDAGRAISAWQLQGGFTEDREVWRTSRRAAATEALRRVHRSLGACQKNEPDTRLAAYASGRCTTGHKAARELHAAVKKALSLMPGPEMPVVRVAPARKPTGAGT